MNAKIHRFLPKIYAAADVNSALRHLLDALGRRMEEVERDLIRITLSHYVEFASGDVLTRSVNEDLDRIGALYNIPRVIERVVPTEERDEGQLLEEHRQFLERYRKRLKDTIQIFLGGVATARAIVKTVAAVFGLEIVTIVLPNQKKTITHDNQIFELNTNSHTTAALLQRPERDEPPFLLEIADHPLRQRARVVIEQEASVPFTVEHRGLDGVHPKITITTGKDPELEIGAFGQNRFNQVHFDISVPLAFPVLSNSTLGQIICFNDIVPSEKELIIDFDGQKFTAFLNQEDVSDRLFFLSGARLTNEIFGQSRFGVMVQNPRFIDLQIGAFDSSQFGNSIFHFIDPDTLLEPTLRPGNNAWEYTHLRESFDPLQGVSQFMEIILDEIDVLPREIKFQWTERASAAFAVRIPRSIGFLVSDRERELFIATVNLVKAAGIEPIFDFQNIFSENQALEDQLFSMQHQVSAKKETQDQSDRLTFSGLFSRTYFNTSDFQ